VSKHNSVRNDQKPFIWGLRDLYPEIVTRPIGTLGRNLEDEDDDEDDYESLPRAS